MTKRRTNQEWQILIEQSESSSLPIRAFCKLNGLSPSTFYAKRQQLNQSIAAQGFVRAEVIEKTTSCQVAHRAAESLTDKILSLYAKGTNQFESVLCLLLS